MHHYESDCGNYPENWKETIYKPYNLLERIGFILMAIPGAVLIVLAFLLWCVLAVCGLDLFTEMEDQQ